jgi:two-component system, NarL family, sensor kinase
LLLAQRSQIQGALRGIEVRGTLCIRDNGRGFQCNDETSRHGLGLRLMQERVEELHGTLKLEGTLDQGATLEISIPL